MARIPIVGPSVESIASDANFQQSINLFPIDPGLNGRGDGALIPSQGLTLLTEIAGQEGRGLITVGTTTYKVVDHVIYKITINTATYATTVTALGTIQSTTGVVRFARNPTQIFGVDGTPNGYVISLTDDTITTLNSDDSFFGGTHVIFYDGYFIYNQPGTAYIRASALNNGLSWNVLDVATAESKPDNIVGLAVTKGEVWVFGDSSVEIWYDAANSPGFPLSPRVGAELSIGCAAGGSIVEINNSILWLDSRGFISQSQVSPYIRNQSSVYELSTVSSPEVNAQITTYDRIDDAIAMTFNDRGHINYQITFPSNHVTWVLDLTTSLPHQVSYYDTYYNEHREHLAQFATQNGFLTLVSGYRSGKIYITSPNYYTDGDSLIHRVRRTATISQEGKIFTVEKLELRLSADTLPTGDGSDPQILMRYSNDGGHSWSNYIARSMGLIGQYAKHVMWNRLGYATEWLFEFTITAPINFSLIEGYIITSEVEL